MSKIEEVRFKDTCYASLEEALPPALYLLDDVRYICPAPAEQLTETSKQGAPGDSTLLIKRIKHDGMSDPSIGRIASFLEDL
jgi:hypothetical protein